MTMYGGLTMLWSILAGKFGFGRFWPKKWFWSILTEKNWVLTGKTGCSRFWPKEAVAVDFD